MHCSRVWTQSLYHLVAMAISVSLLAMVWRRLLAICQRRAASMSSLVWRVVAIVLGDIAGVAGVLAYLNDGGTGNSLGNSLDMLSKALEDIPSV
jgi:hypothetical protein